MFLAGKKYTLLKSKTPHDLTCPNCYTINSTTISIIGIYKHLLQIPFVSGGKFGKSNCSNCNEMYQLKNMPALIKLAYFELKETVKIPIWFYTGLIAIKILVLIKIFSKYF
jgi:hypothetical protein